MTSRKAVGADKDQAYKERREITREEVQRMPCGATRESREREEMERIAPYREMRERRREEVSRTQTEITEREHKREAVPIIPPSKIEEETARRRGDYARETVTTEVVRNFPRVAIPAERSPTPPRLLKSTMEVAREELIEEKKKKEEKPKEKELSRDYRELREHREERYETYDERRKQSEDTVSTTKRTVEPEPEKKKPQRDYREMMYETYEERIKSEESSPSRRPDEEKGKEPSKEYRERYEAYDERTKESEDDKFSPKPKDKVSSKDHRETRYESYDERTKKTEETTTAERAEEPKKKVPPKEYRGASYESYDESIKEAKETAESAAAATTTTRRTAEPKEKECSKDYRESSRNESYEERKKETEDTVDRRTKPELPSYYQEEHQHYTRRAGGLGPRTQPTSGMAHTGASEFLSGSSVTASEIRDIREREKREMRGLNDRLAAYIEQVRFLEAQNRKLNHDLERLTKGKHAPGIRMMYEKEISQSQSIIEEAKKDYGNLEKEVRSLTSDLTDIRNRYDAAVKARNLGEEDDLIVKLCDLQAQICMTKRRNAVIEEECKRIRGENLKLNSDLAAQRQLLEKESLQRMNYEHQAQALIEECKVIASSNNVKLDKYKYHDTTEENRAIFRQGLQEAIAEIRKLYDEATSKFRSEMESWYSKQVIEIRTGARHAADASSIKEKVKTLRAELTEMRSKLANLEGRNHILEKLIQDLTYQIEDENRVSMAHLSEKDDEIRAVREQCQAITVELEKLILEKVNLDAEISKYRQLLEGEENRTHGRVISTVSHSFEPATQTNVHVRSTATRRTAGSSRFEAQRSAQGNVSISEVASDGSYVTIENTSMSHDEIIGGWKLRSVGSGRDVSFTFPKEFKLSSKSKVTVYARGKGTANPPHSLVFEAEDSFATGGDVRTYLYNEENQERAKIVQRSAGI